MQDLVFLTQNMANAAAQIAQQYFRTNFTVDHKNDDSPVTAADREIEACLREMIETERPQDGFLGEEHGKKPSENGLTWVVDPIDGTKSFVAGRPSFGTLIALWEADQPLIGVIAQPITGELWMGVKDRPTTLNGYEIQTNKSADPKKLRIGSTSPSQFDSQPELLKKLRESADFFIWGGDCYLYGMLAFGGLDVVIESGLATYDYAAIPSVVKGAGGWSGDWDGNPMTLDSRGDFLCCATDTVAEQVLGILQAKNS